MIQLKDVIHYYIGQPCRVKDVGRAAWISSVDEFGGVTAKLQGRAETVYEAAEGVTPILRRLEDMTEEEMIGLLQSMVPEELQDKPKDDDYSLEIFRSDGGNLVGADVAVGANYNCICYDGQIAIKKCGTIAAYDESGDEQELVNSPRAYHYLLQQGFDLFGLIDSNQAIGSKTIKQ